MRHLFVLVVTTFTALVCASAQKVDEVYRDEFTDNKGRWPMMRAQQGEAGLVNGVYVVERRMQQGEWVLETNAFVDYDADFDVEIRVRHIGGATDQGFGIVWGAQSAQNCNVAVVRADGQCKVHTYTGGWQTEVVRWSPISDFPASGTWFNFTLRKRGNGMSLLLDGATILGFDVPPIFAGTVGIAVAGRQRVEFDAFIVREVPRPLPLAEDHPVNVMRENLGPQVNCDGGDLSPVITANGKRLYFGRYPFVGNIGDPRTEDIWYTDLQPDGTWGPAQNIGRPLNNGGANFLVSITPDENSMIVGNTYWENGAPRGAGISGSVRTADGWTVPREIRIDNYYNTHQFAETCLDPSGQVLMMAIQRTPTRGQRDLYVSRRRSDGTFTEPQNCGPQINTWGNEMTPFIAADGRTVYFATDGRRGYGGVDIWMSRRLDDTWTNWSEPKNLGPFINTPEWDAYFSVPASGDYAYLSGQNPANNSADLYRIKLTKGVSPLPVVLVSGRVLDAKTKQPIATNVAYESLTRGTSAGTARSEPTQGAYRIVLPSGDLYGFRAEANGYYPVSDQLDTRTLDRYTEITRDLYLVPLKKDERIVLNNLFFDFGSDSIRTESYAELDRLATFLASRPSVTIELSGHTDNVGTEAANKTLSQDRVNAVKAYLEAKGVAGQRMKAVGYGKSKPLAGNTTEEGRQRNRRVEFRILSI